MRAAENSRCDPLGRDPGAHRPAAGGAGVTPLREWALPLVTPASVF